MIYLMIGIQGSGKSTFSKAFSRDNNIEIISTDGIRQKNPGIDEKLVWPTVYDLLAEKVRNNEDAIFDATNITPKVRERFFKNLSDRGVSPTVIAYFFDTPVEVCHERVVNRNKKENELFLPPEVVYSYHESLIKPVLDEGFREIRIVRNNEVVETIKPLIPMRNDYCGIMDDRLLKIIESHNHNHYIGYGEDDESILAKELIKREIGNKNAEILFMIGGTSVNKTVIMHSLAGYEAVIACDTGHINVHESGAIEETGHKILTVPNVNGKLDLEAVRKVYHDHCDYHMVKPAMIYISNTTELGTIYNKEELLEIRKLCDELNLLLFIDGARLYSALNSKKCDYDLKFIASISDVFYIGGTKIGAPMGECLVIINDKLKSNILFSVKRAGGMLAKGFINGLIFRYGIEKGIFNDNAKRENELAERLENSLKELGVKFLMNGESNQIFPIVTNTEYEYLTKYIDFELWQDKGSAKVIRLVTSYMTKDIDIEKTINCFKEIRDIEGLKC